MLIDTTVTVPEWSKGEDLSPSVVRRVGSNPTGDNVVENVVNYKLYTSSWCSLDSAKYNHSSLAQLVEHPAVNR